MIFKRLSVGMFAVTMFAAASGQTTPDYDAYSAAMHRKDAPAKADALELFLKAYPSSGLRERALESLVQVYRDTGSAKEWSALDELLRISPNNLYGLTVKASVQCDAEPRHGMCADQESELATRGLHVLATATKPAYMNEAEFAVRKAQAAVAFHSLAGSVALMRGDYNAAKQHYGAAVEIDPANLASVYPLALACINANPPDSVRGLFFLARAAGLAQSRPQLQIAQYGKTEYVKYHGSEQGWPELLHLAKTSAAPPAGFSITPAH